MGKKSGSAPAAPNAQEVARDQGVANTNAAVTTAALNRINQITPYGNLSYEMTGYDQPVQNSAGKWIVPTQGAGDYTNYEDALAAAKKLGTYTATTTLAPDQQKMLDLTNQAGINYGTLANQQLSNLSGLLSKPVDYSSLGAAPVANEATRTQVAGSIMDRLNPQFDRDRAALETRLANQGIGLGSQAYTTAMDALDRSRNDARISADTQALGQMAQLYGLESAQRNAAINEMLQQRSVPLNELAAMLTGAQVQSPSFVNTPQVSTQAGDYQGAAYNNYNAQLNAYNQNKAANTSGSNALMGGLFGLGSAALAAPTGTFAFLSDRRLKRNIRAIGRAANGLTVYSFNYLWNDEPQVGFMADEVKRKNPQAIIKVGKFDAVDYREAVKHG